MSEFVMDTSGFVAARSLPLNGPGSFLPGGYWPDLDTFTQNYLTAMFFTENDPAHTKDAFSERGLYGDNWEGTIPCDAGFSDLSGEALTAILTDCAAFQALPVYSEVGDDATAGRDFWYTRQGHGCGFWDGDWSEPLATQLTAACKGFPEVYVYFGDDGKIYL